MKDYYVQKRRLNAHLKNLFVEMGGEKVFIFTLLAAVLSLGVSYALNLFLAQIFAPEEFGEISAILSISFLFSGYILLGSDQSCVKFIPEYFAEGNYPKLHGLHTFYLRHVIFFSLFLLLAGLGVSSFIWGFRQDIAEFELSVTWEYLWLIPLVALLLFFSTLLRAVKKPVDSMLTYAVLPPLFLMIGLILWKNISDELNLRTAMFIYAFIVLCVIIYQVFKVRRALSPHISVIFQSVPEKQNKIWFITGIQLLFAVLLTYGEGLVNVLFKLTGQYNGESLAIFNAVATLADFMWISYYTCSVILDSVIAPGALLSSTSKFQHIINKGNIIMSSFGVLFLLIFIFFGKTLLSYFGPTYVVGYPALLLMGTGYLLSLCAGLAWDIMEYAVDPHILVIVNTFGLVGVCFLGFFLIYFWGLYGGCVTMILIEAGSTLIYAAIIRKKLRIRAFGIC